VVRSFPPHPIQHPLTLGDGRRFLNRERFLELPFEFLLGVAGKNIFSGGQESLDLGVGLGNKLNDEMFTDLS
jgi:hypothetical protein